MPRSFVCTNCRQPFAPNHPRRDYRYPLYCSRTCRIKAQTKRQKLARQANRQPISCRICRRLFNPIRSDAKTCSDKCRARLSRQKNYGKNGGGVPNGKLIKLGQSNLASHSPDIRDAHQRIIAQQHIASEPRARVQSLAGYQVGLISRSEAFKLISFYEWLGTMGASTIFVGLLSPVRELHGAACFGHGPSGGRPKDQTSKWGNTRERLGGPAWCLERGACVHYAPPNAASFLINAACKLVFKHTGVSRFFAYADPSAGEYGGVYQAAGWVYLGQGLKGKINRAERIRVLPPGKDPNKPSNWQSTRALRTARRHLSFKEAKALGWLIDNKTPGKHVYATCVAPPLERKKWRKTLGAPLPYPSPRPQLKRIR